MIGHLILISLVVFYLFSIHFKEIIDFFEKIPKILGFIVFWGALFGIIYILSLLSIDWTISFYGIFFTSIVFAVVESIYE
jgi:nicotinamide riboside transporter PnuC